MELGGICSYPTYRNKSTKSVRERNHSLSLSLSFFHFFHAALSSSFKKGGRVPLAGQEIVTNETRPAKQTTTMAENTDDLQFVAGVADLI